jgi:hypothetical protein
MNDPFLEALKADWRRGDIDPGRLLEDLERHRRHLRLLLALEAVGGSVAALFGIWCAWRAIAEPSALFGLAAAALLSAVTLSLPAVRRPPALRLEEGPLGTLQRTRRDLDELERALARWRRGAWILLGCVAALWLLHAAGETGLREAALLSVAWGGSAAGVALWSARRVRRIRRERAACERLLAEYQAADS